MLWLDGSGRSNRLSNGSATRSSTRWQTRSSATAALLPKTIVVVHNHGSQDLFYLSSSLQSGLFTAGAQPSQIAAGTIGGYKVESHGIATGVTGADVRFGFSPSDSDYCLRIVSSNPYGGDNSAQADGQGGITVKSTFSVGNSNQVDVDVYASS